MPAIAAQVRRKMDAAEWEHLRCSFCGREGNQVRFLAAGATAKICNTCCLKALAIFVVAYVRHPFGVRR
jgi:hypothetical protein